MRQRNLLDFQNTTVLQKYLLNHEIEIYAINPIFLVLECIFFNLLNFNSIMYEIFTGNKCCNLSEALSKGEGFKFFDNNKKTQNDSLD